MYEIETGHKVPKQRRKAGSVPKAVQQAFNDYAVARVMAEREGGAATKH